MYSRLRLAGDTPFLFRQRKIKGRTHSRLTFRPDTAPVTMDYPFYGGEANAGAYVLVLLMKTGKRLEQTARFIHIEPAPVVPHINDKIVPDLTGAHFDDRIAAIIGCKLVRIPDEVFHYYLEKAVISRDTDIIRGYHPDQPSRV